MVLTYFAKSLKMLIISIVIVLMPMRTIVMPLLTYICLSHLYRLLFCTLNSLEILLPLKTTPTLITIHGQCHNLSKQCRATTLKATKTNN